MTAAWATSATTIARACSDQSGLQRYLQAAVVETLVQHRDLLDAALVADPAAGWRGLSPIVEEAERRRGKPEAQRGTTVHAAVQRIVEGGDTGRIPGEVLADAAAALDALAAVGFVPVASEVRRVVLDGLPEVVAGTCDLIVADSDGDHFIADIKTADKLGGAKYKALEWQTQLALYANGGNFDGPEWKRDQYRRPWVDHDRVVPDPWRCDREEALVVEVVRGRALAEVHVVDLRAGWRAADLACAVRAARRTAGIETLLTVQPAVT